MTRKNRIQRVELLDAFRRDFGRLSPDLQSEVEAAIRDLVKDPLPAARRIEKLGGFRNPDIYTVHVTRNHSHKLSFELRGAVAVLRRIATHKIIDRAP